MSTKKFAVSLLTVLAAMLVIIPAAFAAGEVSEAQKIAEINASSWKAIAAGLAIAIAAFGGALAQGRAAAAALEGIARNPSASGKLFTPMILGLALIESLVIYALLIAFLIKP
ncbi:MAG: F0F1 ATP synthase subunit C [Deltaproteobacteria bacterium CG2_30_63_29]|nr:MAG: F0F1 ATP synthase subunit C [Deltaproteobacteria bacterium CG2_30_63_29]PJB34574.1 MAG: F0F1 ATP synthase subunit C [Deltaproteobacteria bacterium CG_4_9_14_3_um_filter_63_12]